MTEVAESVRAQDWAVITLLHETHELRTHSEGYLSTATTQTLCACAWSSEPTTGSLRAQWQASDEHLFSVLPAGTVTALCWCSRLAVRAESTGAWYHAASPFMGHRALDGLAEAALADRLSRTMRTVPA